MSQYRQYFQQQFTSNSFLETKAKQDGWVQEHSTHAQSTNALQSVDMPQLNFCSFISESSKTVRVTWSKTHPAHTALNSSWVVWASGPLWYVWGRNRTRPASSHSFSWTIQRHRSCHCSFEFCQQMGQRFPSPDPRLSARCTDTYRTPLQRTAVLQILVFI